MQLERNFIQEFLEQQKRLSTKSAYTVGLDLFSMFLSEQEPALTFNGWLELVDADRLRSAILMTNVADITLKDYRVYLESKTFEQGKHKGEKEYSANTINLYVSAVTSLISYIYRGKYAISTKWIGLPKAEPESLKEEWTPEKLSECFLSIKKQVYRAVFCCFIQSGLGIEEILNLKYRDIKEELTAGLSPIVLYLKRKKTEIRFYTCLGSIAVTQLKLYFAEVGTPLDDQPIFHQLTKGKEMRPIAKSSIEKYFARLARKSLKKAWVGENPRRPHSLRGAFQKLLILSDCPEVFSEYWMGHETSKNKKAYLLKGMGREEHREQYRKFEHALSFETAIVPQVVRA